MKITRVLVPCLLVFMALGSKAQTAAEISDEDLQKYAVTMDSVEAMQGTLREIVAETVRNNDVMSISRYNELFKLDSTQLQAAKATPEEIAFLKQIDDLRAVNIERINTTYQSLAKDYVGLKTFNTIRKALQSDQELKERYNDLSSKL